MTGEADRSAPAIPRRQLVLDSLGISLSAAAFGLVYGLAARSAGFSVIDAMAASVFVLAGAAQFAAVGLVASGAPWLAIVLLTALLNARHLLYSAALAPWFGDRPRLERAAMAHVLTDETFALSFAHLRRIGRPDRKGYWIAAAFVCLPWIAATGIGVIGGAAIPDPATLGLDVVFPAAMAGLCVAVARGKRGVIAAVTGAAIAVAVSLASDPSIGVVAGGVLGPIAGMIAGGPADPADATSGGDTAPAARLPG